MSGALMQSAILELAIHNEITAAQHDSVSKSRALENIAQIMEDYQDGVPIGIDSRPYFPFWYRGLAMQRRQ